MKKLFLAMFALICFGAVANAQVCKISGSNDSVEVFGCSLDVESRTIFVTVSNDSNDISANVTVSVELTHHRGVNSINNVTDVLQGKGRAEANQSTVIKIQVPSNIYLDSKSTAECKGISGTKCM